MHFHIGRWTFGVWLGLGWELGGEHEYWRRYVVGPFYVLRPYSAEYWRARDAELDAMFPDDGEE